MIRLYYSNSLTGLIDLLARSELVAARSPLDLLEIATPGAPTSAHLRFGLAQTLGICHGIELTPLEGCLSKRAETCASRTELAQELLAAFTNDEVLARVELDEVARYLRAGPGVDSRRFQLADEVAGLFLEYDRAQPEMLEAWTRGNSAGASVSASERWQAELWRYIHLEREKAPLVTSLLQAEGQSEAPPVILFGFHAMPRGLCRAIEKLARSCDVSVYALTPTREFWEDLATDPDQQLATGRALRLWGRTMGATSRALNEACEYDFKSSFTSSTSASLLGQWQRDTHELRSASGFVEADGSIRIHQCTSVRRELETLAETMWALLESEPTLDCAEIALYIASDYETYLSQLPGVFRSFGSLPHHFIGAPVGVDSRLIEAFELLATLPLGDFTRAEMLAIMTHPSIGPAGETGDADFWLTLADELGIARAESASALADSYIKGDLFNWDQGIRRICLGALFGPSHEQEILNLDGPEFVPLELDSDRRNSATMFALLARSLIADAREATALNLTLRDWSRWFSCIAKSYIRPRTTADERLFSRLLDAIETLARADNGVEISYHLAAASVRREIAGLRVNVGEVAARGIMVAPLDLRYIAPAKHLFIAGLGEEALPAAGFSSALDTRKRGTGMEPSDWVRGAFLAAGLAAGDSFQLSYVAREPTSGDALAPSSLIAELKSLLLSGYVSDDGGLVSNHELHAWLEEAAVYSPSKAVRRRAAIRSATGSRVPYRGHPPASPTEPEEPGDGDQEVRLDHLRAFLESPVQGWARHSMGIYEERDERSADVRDEPIEIGPLQKSMLLRDVFLASYRDGDDSDALHARLRLRLHREVLAGQFPAGVFGERLENELLATLEHWRESVGGHSPPRVLSFGNNRSRESIDERRAALVLEDDTGRRFSLIGTSRPRLDDVGSLILTPGKSVGAKHRVRGFFDHVVLTAADALDGEGGFYVLGAAGTARRFRLKSLTADVARDYLLALVAELIGHCHAYSFPCEQALSSDPSRPTSGTSSDDFGPLLLTHPLPQPANPRDLHARRFALLREIEERVR